MHIESLVRMANQIGAFFEAMPDRREAQEGVAQHLQKFWEPRMRRALLAELDAGRAVDLSGFVAEAIARHRPWLV